MNRHTIRKLSACLALACLSSACGSDPPLHAFFLAQPRPLIFAHRFGGGVRPEETILTMLATHQRNPMGVLEFDVQVSKDGAPVVIHDDDVERTTNGRGKVRDLTLLQLKALDAGYCATPNIGNGTAERGDCHSADAARFPFRGQGHQIATLGEVLAAMPLGAFFSVEVKAPGIDTEVAKTLRASGRLDHLIAGAEPDDIAARLQAQLPEVPSYYPTNAATCLALSAKARWNYAACPRFDCFASPLSGGGLALDTKGVLSNAHSDGIAVVYWTINDAATMERLFRLGADGIYTDYPDLARDVLARLRTNGILK